MKQVIAVVGGEKVRARVQSIIQQVKMSAVFGCVDGKGYRSTLFVECDEDVLEFIKMQSEAFGDFGWEVYKGKHYPKEIK